MKKKSAFYYIYVLVRICRPDFFYIIQLWKKECTSAFSASTFYVYVYVLLFLSPLSSTKRSHAPTEQCFFPRTLIYTLKFGLAGKMYISLQYPDDWEKCVSCWNRENRMKKEIDGLF